MNFSQGRSYKLLTFTALCASLAFSCNKKVSEEYQASENIVETTETQVVSTSKVIDFQILAKQQLTQRGLISLPDFVKTYPEFSERTTLLASVDKILETSAGHWQFYANFKLLFTLVSSDRLNMQAINGHEHLFNNITLHTDKKTKLADAIIFNISDCQFASASACDPIDAIIYVNTLNGTPRTDQDQDQDQDQDKDQDKDQDQTQDTGDSSDQTPPPVTSGTVSTRF